MCLSSPQLGSLTQQWESSPYTGQLLVVPNLETSLWVMSVAKRGMSKNLIFQGCPPSAKRIGPRTSAGLAGSPVTHGDGKSTTSSCGGNMLQCRNFDTSFWAVSTAADAKKGHYDFVIFHNSLPCTILERQTTLSCWRTDVKTGVIYTFSATTMFPCKACHNTALGDLAKFTRGRP